MAADDLPPAAAADARERTLVAEALSRIAAVRGGQEPLHDRLAAELSARVARELGLSESAVLRTRLACYLRNLGRLVLPESVLLPEGSTDAHDLAIWRRHPQIGAELVRTVGGLDDTAPAIAAHHERWDGSGYPAGLRGDEIPIEAQALAAAAAFTRLVADDGLSREAAVARVHRAGGRAFSERVVAALDRALAGEDQRAGQRLGGSAG